MSNIAIRNKVLDLEEAMQGIDTVTDWDDCIEHHFSHGTYARDMRLNADSVIVGKLHRYSCINFLLEGSVCVEGEFESETYDAPHMWISCAGTKRAIYALSNCRWITVHENPSNTRDLDEIERHLIAENYAALMVGG